MAANSRGVHLFMAGVFFWCMPQSGEACHPLGLHLLTWSQRAHFHFLVILLQLNWECRRFLHILSLPLASHSVVRLPDRTVALFSLLFLKDSLVKATFHF